MAESSDRRIEPRHFAKSAPTRHSCCALVLRSLPLVAGAMAGVAMAAGRVVPGDQVTLVLEYRNTAAAPLANVVLANPVPRGRVFRAAAPGTPAPEVSIDGTNFSALDRLVVRAADGARRPAVPADIVAVRWRLSAPVPAGGQGRLAFRAALE